MTTPPNTQPDASQIAREIRAGLEGVTPGEWKAAKPDGAPSLVRAVYYLDGLRHTAFLALCECGGQNNEANAAHLARCSPDRIAALLDAFDAQTREIAELREALEPFAEVAPHFIAHVDTQYCEAWFRVGDLRRARQTFNKRIA